MYLTLSRPSLTLLFLSVVGFVLSSCNFGESGITPPRDRIFLPTGLVADPYADFLYVVNSNSDLRYNAGTLVAIDVNKVLTSIERYSTGTSQPLPSCGKTRFTREERVAADYCCRDIIDSNIVNCHERQFIRDTATVQIGSFGGSVVLQPFEMDGLTVRRLYIAVRAEPSITFADVRLQSDQISIRCTGPRTSNTVQPPNAFCDDHWRIRRPAGATTGSFVLSEEPHRLLLDASQSALFVGHLTVSANNTVEGGGISTLDVCHPELPTSPRFAGQARIIFPDRGLQSVGALSYSPQGPVSVYATARYSPVISGLVFRAGQVPCAADASNAIARDLTLVPNEFFLSSAFLPAGTDIRGILFSEDNLTAYILHRDAADIISNTSALVAIDRRIRADGSRSNQPISILKVCNGPSEMVAHDAGYGKRIYISCYDDAQIYVVDPIAWRVESIIDVGSSPTSLVFLPSHPTIAMIANFAGNHLSVIDLDQTSRTRNRVVHRIGLPHGYGE